MLRQFCSKLSFRPSHSLLQYRIVRAIPAYRHLDNAAAMEPPKIWTERRLIARMDRMLRLRMFALALALFHDKISKPGLSRLQIEATFEAACVLLLDYKRIDEALDLYEEMQTSGFRGSFSLQSTMLLLRCARSNLGVDNMAEALGSRIQALREGSEAHLLSLLNEMRRYGHDYHASLRVVDHFLGIQGSSYRLGPATITHLINRSPEDPPFHEAEKWLRYHRENVRNPSIPPDSKDAYPYTAFIHFSNKKDTDLNFRYKRILRYMSEDGVPPDSALLNVLIQIEVRRGNHSLAFQLYSTMSKTGRGPVQADEFTYCSLFDAFERVHVKSSRPFTQNTSSDAIIRPRRLFFEMLCAFRFSAEDASVGSKSDSRHILGIPPLSQALKVFMNLKDYAAAMIVLETIANLGWDVDAKTCDAVTHALAKRIYKEAFTSEKLITWSNHFMCLQEGNKEQIRKLPFRELILRVERVGEIIAKTVDPTIQRYEIAPKPARRWQRERVANSVPRISPKYVAFLLKILVRRALEASLGSSSDISSSGGEAARGFDDQIEVDIISPAREEMIPKLDDLATLSLEPPMEDSRFI